MSVQNASTLCDCGRRAPVTPTTSPWSFGWSCVCGRVGQISWAHAQRPPSYEFCDHKFIDSVECLKCGFTPRTEGLLRFFDDDKVGCYLDDIGHRVERTKEGNEVKMVDLTLRVQPFTPELAVSCDPDIRSMLFSMTDSTPKPKIGSLTFNIKVPKQQLAVYLLPEDTEAGAVMLSDVEITVLRARTEKGVDGYGFLFYASLGPVGARELEYFCNWHTQQRFITFHPQQADLLDGGEPPTTTTPRRGRRPAEVTA